MTTILHVEDDLEIARQAKRWLLDTFNNDAIVFHAESANEAIRIISGTSLDLILCDYDLGMGPRGDAVLEYVRDRKRELADHFVFFSASTAAQRLIKRAGRYLDKPSDYETFAMVVRDAARAPAQPTELSDGVKLARCAGCRDDFYNGKNPLNVKRCWSFEQAMPVIRWRLGTWIKPTESGAFTEVETLNCHSGQGYVHYKELPLFAIKPNRLRGGE